ncbi:MAG: diguanylate cyclase, partial [Ruminococcus sp.]|nr:diguanylate cyclase [Ruminococcus sp.]
ACIGLSIVVLFTLLTGVLAFLPLTKANDQLTGSEYLDAITGRLNEYGLDEMISEMLETSLVGSTYAFIMIGIKDSEQIKSTVSLGYWNDIRTSLADKAESFFAERIHHIGRAYDDYIVIFADYSEFDLFKAHNELRNGCEQLLESFRDFVVGEDGSLKLNVVIGASVYPDDGDDFDTLLGKARQAYKAADKKEGSAFSIYKNNSANGSKESSK